MGRMAREKVEYQGDMSTTSAVWRAQQIRKGTQVQASVIMMAEIFRCRTRFRAAAAGGDRGGDYGPRDTSRGRY